MMAKIVRDTSKHKRSQRLFQCFVDTRTSLQLDAMSELRIILKKTSIKLETYILKVTSYLISERFTKCRVIITLITDSTSEVANKNWPLL